LARVHDAGAENHANVIEIVGGTGHQLAGAVANVELRLHQQEAVEEVAANVELDVARDADENPPRREREGALEQDANQKHETIDAERVAAVRRVERNGAAQPGAGKQMSL
jgi:hypothetical protein